MKKLAKHTMYIQTFFHRYHHFILTGLCLLFIAVSLAITGCNIIDRDSKTEEEKGLETLRQTTEQYKDVEAAVDETSFQSQVS